MARSFGGASEGCYGMLRLPEVGDELFGFHLRQPLGNGAFARVYLGAHNPLDVLGGFGLGLAIGGAANLIVGVPEPATTGQAG